MKRPHLYLKILFKFQIDAFHQSDRICIKIDWLGNAIRDPQSRGTENRFPFLDLFKIEIIKPNKFLSGQEVIQKYLNIDAAAAPQQYVSSECLLFFDSLGDIDEDLKS